MWKKIFVLIITIAITPLTPPAIAETPLLSMSDFAYGAELDTSEAKFTRFTLIPDMVKNIKRQDLGDIRIFDSNNELIPALVRKKDGDNKLKREILNFSRIQSADDTTSYILDRTENHRRSLKSLSLQWQQNYAPNMLLIRVDHSADKLSWETLKDSEAINNFKFEGIVLKQNVITINDHTQRYIKITFQNRKQPSVLASVHAYTSDRKISDYTWIPAGKITPQPGKPDAYRFKLGDGIRPELFKLSFPALNTILNGSLNGLQAVDEKLKYTPVIKNFDAYVVTINNKVINSMPINISRWQYADWLIIARATKNIDEENLPGIDLAYPQYEIIFANNGEGPFTVVWGNPAAGKPVAGDLAKQIHTQKDIAEIRPGTILGNRQLTELMESRQTPWLMLSISVAVIILLAIAFIFGYRRYQQGRN
ncbi:MAG: DUF3999 domain-containing protein [Gammaproteobacteria bacterium]|nr:DUF3999 domain-containing protein [Gammaproteobacteria bacterium]